MTLNDWCAAVAKAQREIEAWLNELELAIGRPVIRIERDSVEITTTVSLMCRSTCGMYALTSRRRREGLVMPSVRTETPTPAQKG